MAARIRVTCTYAVPHGLEWAGKLNSSFHPPAAFVDGKERSLTWDEATEIEVAPGHSHTLEVYFSVFDVLRMCGAEATVEPLREGETRSYQYVVELKDRYLNRGHLSPVD